MASITGATAVVMFTIPGLFPVPIQLQGFAADDVFNTDALESAEVLMGVDGRLSGGFVFVPVKQNYMLQADSPSIEFFDTWWGSNQAIRDLYTANGLVSQPALGKKFTMTRGFLTGYKPMGDTKKLIQPQPFAITWESILPAVI